MDTYNLINSKAIQEHCRKINHQFNTLELAVLIYRNKRMSINEKISAYKELITDYPDMKLIKKYRPENYDTVKEMVQGEIERIENLVNILKTDEQDVIYTYNYYCKNIYDNGIIEGKNEYRDVYKTLKEVKDVIQKDIEEDEEKEILSFAIRKRKISNTKNEYEIRAEYLLDENRNLKLVNIYDFESEYLDISMICLNIPTPFKEGDLLISTSDTPFSEGYVLDNKRFTFVLDNLITWRDNFQEALDRGSYDSSDMEGTGYSVTDEGRLYLDNIFDYDGWEFFDGELKGNERILRAVSNLIKGEISIDLFLQGYEYIKSENEVSLNLYTPKGLELVGLTKRDIKTLEFKREYKEKLENN